MGGYGIYNVNIKGKFIENKHRQTEIFYKMAVPSLVSWEMESGQIYFSLIYFCVLKLFHFVLVNIQSRIITIRSRNGCW